MRKGSQLKDIATEFGIDKRTVYSAVHKLFPDIEINDGGKYDLSPERLDVLREYVARPSGATIKAISDELDVDVEIIAAWVHKLFPNAHKTRYGMDLAEDQVNVLRQMKQQKLLRGKPSSRKSKTESGSIMERIERVAEARHIRMKDARKRMRIEPSVFSKLRSSTASTSVKNLILIAKFFDTSIDYLVGLKEEM